MRFFLAACVFLNGLSLACGQGPPDPKNVKPILTIDASGHMDRVAALAFTQDGQRLFTMSHDNTIQEWDTLTRERVRTLRLPRRAKDGLVQEASQIEVSPDGKTLALLLCVKVERGAAGTNQHYDLFLLHLEMGRLVRVMGLDHSDRLAALTFSPSGDWLAAGTIRQIDKKKEYGSTSIHLWRGLHKMWENESSAPKLFREIKGFGHIGDIQFAPSGKKVAVAGNGTTFIPDKPAPPSKDQKSKSAAKGKNFDGQIFLWNLTDPNGPPRTLQVNPKHVDRLAWSPEGSLFAVITADPKAVDPHHKTLRAMTLDGLVLRSATYEAVQPSRPIFRGENEVLLLGASPEEKKTPAVLRLELKKKNLGELLRFTPATRWHGWQLASDGKRLALITGAGQDQVAILDLGPNAKLQPLYTIQATPNIAFSKTGLKLAWTGNDPARLIAAVNLATAERLTGLNAGDFLTPGSSSSTPGKGLAYRAAQSRGRGGHINVVRDKTDKTSPLKLHAVGQDWVVWTSEGYYAASPGGEKLVGWHVNNGMGKLASFYPLERFRKKFFRPDVLAELPERGSVAVALKVANALRGLGGVGTRDVVLDNMLPPLAVLSVLEQSKPPTVTLKVRAEARVKDQPITALRLMIDGRPVPGNETRVDFPESKDKAEVVWTFELPEGEHQLAVLARSPDSSSVSAPVRLKYADLKKQPVLHVLTVGINNYRDGSLNLNFAAPDAEALAAAFAKHCTGEPFREVKTKTLLNQQATVGNITRELLDLRKEVGQHDLVVVFFACHGVKYKKEYYLLTHEADTASFSETCLSGDALRKSLAEYKCQVLLIMDACHSAGFGQGKKLATLGLKPATDDVARDLTEDEFGVAVMCAAMGHEKAEETGGHGLFTQAMLDALAKKPGVPFNTFNQRLHVHHLHSYVFDQVSHRSQERQHPFLSLPWVVESFVVR
jgi:WD40 repeat protein